MSKNSTKHIKRNTSFKSQQIPKKYSFKRLNKDLKNSLNIFNIAINKSEFECSEK